MGEHDGVERTVELLVNDYDAREKELRDAVQGIHQMGHDGYAANCYTCRALDKLLTFVRAQERRRVLCPRISCGGCRQHSNDYEHTEAASKAAYGAYACECCRILDALMKETP